MATISDFVDLSQLKGVKLVNMNIQRLLKRIDELRGILRNSKLHIVILSESWVRDDYPDNFVRIDGYSSYRQDRYKNNTNKSKGRGFITYISDDLNDIATQLDKLDTCTDYSEAQRIKISQLHSKNIVICNLYRPPEGDLDKATKYLKQCLQKSNPHKSNIFVMGDWNVN